MCLSFTYLFSSHFYLYSDLNSFHVDNAKANNPCASANRGVLPVGRIHSSHRPEQKCDEESKSDEGPEMKHMEEAPKRQEENEGYQKIIEFVSEGSEEEVQPKVLYYVAGIQKLSWVSKEQLEYLGGGGRRAVEARRNGNGDEQEQWRQGQKTGQEQGKQGKQVRFGEEEQLRETRAKRTDEPEVTGGLAEVRTGRGSAGLVRG